MAEMADDASETLLRAHQAAASPKLRYSAVSPVRLDGWLSKEGKALRAHRPRFMRLHGRVLTSHRSKTAPPSWHLSVAHATVEPGPYPRELRLILPHRVLSFIAPTDVAFERWIVALRRASLISSHVEDFYRVGRLIGEGMNGQVRLAHDLLTRRAVAVKMVPRLGRENETQFLAREVQIILSVTHPNIVRTVDVFVRSRRIHFVMEYLAGGELFDFIADNTHFTESHASTVMADLLSALSYLHARGIAHRDVKLENLLCANSTWPLHVKLADFGFANFVGNGVEPVLTSFVGTPYYIAPEMLRGSPHGRPVDIWASGVVLYILLSGKFPFGGNNESEYYQRVLSKEAYFPSEEWDSVSDEAKDLVRGMLCKDPTKRLTADECLRHPWMRKGDTLSEIQPDTEVFPADPPGSNVASTFDFPESMSGHSPECLPHPIVPSEPEYTESEGARPLAPALLEPSSAPVSSPPRRTTPTASGKALAKVETQPMLRSPDAFKDNREKRGKWRYRGMLNHSLTVPTDAMLSTRQAVEKNQDKRGAGAVQVDRTAVRPSALFDEIVAETPEDPTVNRRPSLIRRLLSSGKLSLDRYDGRFPSFRGTVDDPTDEAAAQPRKTLSLFAKDGPIRRSFHRGGESRTTSNDGINFVNSQSQRLPPKIARERQRQQRQAEALRKTPRSGGIFSHRKVNGQQFNSQPTAYHSSPRLQTPLAHPFSSVPVPPGQRGSHINQSLISSHLARRRFSAAGAADREEDPKHVQSSESSYSNMPESENMSPVDDGLVRRTMSADVSPLDRLTTSQFVPVEVLSGRLHSGR